MENKLTLIETKGDVTFTKDSSGKLYQQIGTGEPFKVRNGKVAYMLRDNKGGYSVKYNTNGFYGFSVWKGRTNLEDGIWTIAEANSIRDSFING